jgi:transmembrane sensor
LILAMRTHRGEERRSLEEAAAWFTRLKQPSVSEAAIEAFFAWRRLPANEAAYAEVEARWRQADRIRNDPELVRLTEAALRRETPWMKLRALLRRPIVPLSLAAVAVALGVLVIVAQFRPQTFQTDVGAQQIVRLADGSRLRLNTDSKVEVRLGRRTRHVRLVRGEGFFEVAHDAARPFIVESAGTQVRALGTKFDVRRTAGDTRVTLLEGRVRVSRASGTQAWTLAPNQQITVDGATRGPSPTDAAEATSWTTGRLRFRETPLASAVAEVNRYSRSKIILQADRLSGVRVNGVFETGDTQAFVSAVTELFGLEAKTTADGVILQPRERPASG